MSELYNMYSSTNFRYIIFVLVLTAEYLYSGHEYADMLSTSRELLTSLIFGVFNVSRCDIACIWDEVNCRLCTLLVKKIA